MSALFELLPRPLHSAHDVLLDLGCGDGRIVLHAASHHGVRGYGVDLSTSLLAEARLQFFIPFYLLFYSLVVREKARERGIEGMVEFVEASFVSDEFQFQLPWPVAENVWNGPTVITSYLTYVYFFLYILILKFITFIRPKALRLLEPKLVAYVRKAKEKANIDVQIATLVYSFNNWTPVAENDSLKISIFDFRNDSLRIKNKNTNKDTDGYLPAF
jgi:hypothetical protein